MKNPTVLRFLLSLGLVCALAISARASTPTPAVESLGNNTFSVTIAAKNGFVRDTDKLKEEALDAAKAYCASHNKEMKVITVEAHRPKVMFMAYAEAKVVFKALDANDPELRAPIAPVGNGSAAGYAPAAPAPSSTDALYNDLMKLDDLRKKGVLTEEEFQSEKKKVLNRSN